MRQLKTDDEIKQFIDAHEVITRNELSRFIYGYKDSTNRRRLQRWWEYVLKTKDWLKLQSHAEAKINHTYITRERYNQFKKIYLEDPRLVGKRTSKTILKEVYGVDLSISAISRYLKKIRIENEKISHR